MRAYALLSLLVAVPAAAQTAPPILTLDANDLRSLDRVIQTTIPPAYSVQLVEWINAQAKKQADKDKPHE